MTMTEWFLTELDSEAGKSRRVLEQVPSGKREWKPHERSMALGYLSDLVANIPSWIGYAITLNELDIAPKEGPKYKPAALNTNAELVAALDRSVGSGSGCLATDDRCAPPNALASSRRRTARARAASSPRDSRCVPALGASPRSNDGLPASAWVKGAVGLRPNRRRSKLRMMLNAWTLHSFWSAGFTTSIIES